MVNYEDEYGVLDMSEEAMNTLELMHEKLDDDSCGPEEIPADTSGGTDADGTGPEPTESRARK